MIDITLETKERRLLDLMHPYGCTGRTLILIGKAKPGETDALVERDLAKPGKLKGTYRLTENGEIAIGVRKAPPGGQA
jgi:hypothetical protein